MSEHILEVDLAAFESGDAQRARAVVEGMMTSLETGFVFVRHDLSEDLVDEAYGMLEEFFTQEQESKDRFVAPGTHGQTGYTGLLVETAASADVADWKEMLNWGRDIPAGHPLRTRYPHRYHDAVLPEAAVPGITRTLTTFHDEVADLQRRILRIIATGIGAHADYFERMLVDGPTLSRAIHYPAMESAPEQPHVWAAEHADINLITALPRATASGLQVKLKGVDRRRRPGGRGDHQHRAHARGRDERPRRAGHPPRRRGAGPERRPLLGRAVLPPHPVDRAQPGRLDEHAADAAALQPGLGGRRARPRALRDQPHRGRALLSARRGASALRE
ncbi:hypothetical protein M3697_09765 [Janibacter melonis]|uniref:2-oxoglutarate and iron-dependent oxygenase domain-containing protein n=1 Tax=Janibacter melonis TaxID=262209 RepID=UPI0020444EC5|nr:2-oxoglutarate and iron-dependent oxygenase domain-containing protein [Janibacter melonis]MCM3555390.1 hypothetical protein [Janibacter melonis]